jgi:DNA repair exonuclease SbcCD nuclease subunit
MIIAHLSDLHLGYRAFGNVEQGRNIREADVARAFHQAIQKVVEIAPSVVLVAGDVFDRPEPPHSALVALAQGLQSLREALPDTPVLMAAGARDTPAGSADPGALAAFDTLPGVEAVTATTRSIHYSRLDLNVVLVPHRSTIQGPGPLVEPNPDARWNVLVGYGSVDREKRALVSNALVSDALLSLDSDDWDYVALGHEHFRREVASGVYYAGALERVGATPWEEAAEEKGFQTCDLESGQVRFHPIHGRPVVSLEPIPFEADRPERLRERVREVLLEVPGGIEEKIVRIRIQGLPAERMDLLDGVLPEYRRRALHLEVQLDDEPPGHLSQDVQLSRRLASKLVERLAGENENFDALVELVQDCLPERQR